MFEVILPQLEVNSERALLVTWMVEKGERIKKGQVLAHWETAKSVHELAAPHAGYFFPRVEEGDEADFLSVIAVISETDAEPAPPKAPEAKPNREAAGNFTKKAAALAAQNGLSAADFDKTGIITERDVQSRLRQSALPDLPKTSSLDNLKLPDGLTRVLVITGGIGAMHLIAILRKDPRLDLVGCLDDDPALQDHRLFGVPVLGPLSLLETFWREGRFDQAIIGATAVVATRQKLWDRCKALGIPMANAIDPSAVLGAGVVLGEGNIIGAQVHIGMATRLGDNNFIAAKCNIDHHNQWGSHILTGPGVMSSSFVSVADRVRFGTGIFIEPLVTIGAGAVISSGALLLGPVPADHLVKVRVSTETVHLKKEG
ncbi:biotin/lipoyl-containing protein [Acanthopleuribacter pedis]|uniref:Lipoyl-binding domain-containing protein n=1 Tax=Acanthopleuribacter pedis TaxID=442870 RepID=A0A8J7Q2C6_9BACT|nr:biotin/lipoyl-containing protein [Acanthopleuribacter pedis]MBO1318000.1 hypothetical protein [Acanthopleuribacter pedis]